MSMQSRPQRIVTQAAKYLLIGLVVLYVGDWSVFKVKTMRGAGLEKVSVEQFLKTPLKGNKAEYDYLGNADENCASAMFPQYGNSTWNLPCWWLTRHTVQWQ